MPESKIDSQSKFGVVILNKYPEICLKLLKSIESHHAKIPPILIVCDCHDFDFGERYQQIVSCSNFVFARNANQGIRWFQKQDVILLNDDVEIIQDESLYLLAEEAGKDPRIGMMAPLIDGGTGCSFQRPSSVKDWPGNPVGLWMSNPLATPICFPCICLRRALIDKIGLLDEAFSDYGFEDNDYCWRSQNAGFVNMITSKITVRHGTGGDILNRGKNWSTSFARAGIEHSNYSYYIHKYRSELTKVI